jgi:predicted metal-binding protein
MRAHQLNLLSHSPSSLPPISNRFSPSPYLSPSVSQTVKGEVSGKGKEEHYRLGFINIVKAITCGDCSSCQRLKNEVTTCSAAFLERHMKDVKDISDRMTCVYTSL